MPQFTCAVQPITRLASVFASAGIGFSCLLYSISSLRRSCGLGTAENSAMTSSRRVLAGCALAAGRSITYR